MLYFLCRALAVNNLQPTHNTQRDCSVWIYSQIVKLREKAFVKPTLEGGGGGGAVAGWRVGGWR